jgi:hypothetical protein
MNWLGTDALKLESGFLGSQRFSNDSWNCFYSELVLNSESFQSLSIKPYIQTAVLDGRSVREAGGLAHYHFNMAGLVESEWGGGWSWEEDPSRADPGGTTKGFLRNLEAFDVLGFMNANLALRWDFSPASKRSFSALAGAQGTLGDCLLLGDYAKGVEPLTLLDTQKADAGFRYQPNDQWNLTCRLLHEQWGSDSWDGGNLVTQWKPTASFLFLFHDLELDFEEKAVQGRDGRWLFDSGGRLQWSFFPRNTLRVQGRCISGGAFLCDVDAEYGLGDDLKFFASVFNLGSSPLSWPDPILPSGRVFSVGLENSF